MLIDIIAGARPNFMKIAPIIEAIKAKNTEGVNIQYRLIHTGQHYDKNMSDNFFEQLGIPHPDINLKQGAVRKPNKRQILWSVMKRLYWKKHLIYALSSVM